MSEIRTDTINNASGDNDSGIDLSTNDKVAIKTADTTAITVDSSQRVMIGTTTEGEVNADNLTVSGSGNVGMTIRSTSSNEANIYFSDGTSGDDEYRGFISYNHSDNSVRLGSNASERMRILSDGSISIAKASADNSNEGTSFFGVDGMSIVRSGGTCQVINRLTNDGVLVSFRQANGDEGNISVSGSTVSYNGGHLSRWSQLADNTRDNTILKGTVMTNLDQMAEWTTDGVTEDNEQLNCMAVSSVEGDANVAGVFVNWDNDDDIYTNDMNIAMTGDMVIRIAQGTTVARGDLLMSAGDGTAKPQGDDIVRSKTIAKVTSTNVSHTYDDGSYLVPCVLMAC